MRASTDHGSSRSGGSTRSFYPLISGGISLTAIITTFFLANSSYDPSVKIVGFAATIACVLGTLVLALWMQSRTGTPASDWNRDDDAGIEPKLLALEDAYEFFAGSLNSADAFRLVASRVKDVVPYRSLSLCLLDETQDRFRVADVEGPQTEFPKGCSAYLSDGIAGRSFFTKTIELDSGSASSSRKIAVPLKNEGHVFGILLMDFDPGCDVTKFDPLLLDALGMRAAALILSGLANERSRTKALTDATTDLPNERAFFLVLENQVAESSRKGAARPLTILALDVRSFDDINISFGHAVGDRVLKFVAQVVKDNLRQMDFFARSSADEFLVVLPTASKEVSHEIIARIQTGFFGRKLKITESESVELELNIGWAAFGADGGTTEALLAVARERKEQAKSGAPSKVLWFPAEVAG